jgi:hypothetical protein
MSAIQHELEVKFPSTQSHALQSRAYLDAVSLRKEHRKEDLGVETVLFMDNVAYLMWQARQGVVSLSALLLVCGVLTTLGVSAPAHAQSMLKVRTTESSASNDNSRVIAMMNKGLDDSIIVAKIKSSSWTFKLTDDDMLALRKSGLSAPVVAAMIDSSATATTRVSVDDQALSLDTMGQAKTAGRLLNNLTGDLTPLKENAFLEGASSTISASPMPTILITLPKGESIGNYILVKMSEKGDRRELNVGTGGGIGNGRTGLSSSSTVRSVQVIAKGENTYQLVPSVPLKSGQYMVYVVGSSDERKDIYGKGYDFAVLR